MNTAYVYILSAISSLTLAVATDVLFFVNLGLCFCALSTATAVIVMWKKTAFMRVFGSAVIVAFGVSAAAFCIQLGLYVYGNDGASYAVGLCTGLFCISFVLCGAYCLMLARNSHKKLCIATGVLCLVPPVGAVLAVVLSYKIQRDTSVKKFVYSGYAYTYAALEAFADRTPVELIDQGGAEGPEYLPVKRIKRRLRVLKGKTATAAGKFDYATALVWYAPYKFKKAYKLMQRSADAGYAPALFNLGYFYEIGKYVKRDFKKAREYYKRAGAAGDADSALRLAIVDIKDGNAQAGLAVLNERAEYGDLYAKYDLGVCYELGLGVEKNVDKAFDLYAECANVGMFVAQSRIFAAASKDMPSSQNGDLFRRITDRKFDGAFAIMIDGLIEIKKRHAADASEKFLQAVKMRDRWEGVARCLVGALYIDCGKLPQDRRNGVEYVISAFDLWSGAKDLYAVLPKIKVK